MNFQKITVVLTEGRVSKKVIGRLEHETIAQFKNHNLVTIFQEKSCSGDNELWIMDENGKVTLLSIRDARLVGVYADVLKFTGYLSMDYKIFPRNTRVDVFAWNKNTEKDDQSSI